jgi:hypothetical protein
LKDVICCWKDVNALFTNGLIASNKHNFTERHSTLVMEKKISKKIKKNWPNTDAKCKLGVGGRSSLL